MRKLASKIGIAFLLVFVLSSCSMNSDSSTQVSNNQVKNIYKSVGTFDMSEQILPKVNIETKSEPGREEYVSANISVIDDTNQYEDIMDMGAMIKVRGHSTALAHKKPYNIKFSEKQNVLGMGKSKKWCLLANLFDPTMLRNSLALELAKNKELNYTSNSTFVEVYYNEEYIGLYLMTEPVSKGKDKVDIDVDNNEYLIELQPRDDISKKLIITSNLKMRFSVEEGRDDDLTYISEFLDKFEDSIAGGYDTMTEYADWDSFVDFYVINEYLKDVDFATSSTYFYIKNGKIYAGPVWDYDLSMGNVSDIYTEYLNVDSTKDSTTGFYCNKFWYYYITQIPEFQRDVRKRFNELQPYFENITTDNELGKNRIDVYTKVYKDAFEKNNKVWEIGKSYGENSMQPLPTYEENVEYLRQWLINRNEWLKSQWNEYKEEE